MLVLEPFTEDHGRSMVRSEELPPLRLLAPRGFATHRLAYVLDSLVRVSRRAGWKRCASVSSVQVPWPAERTLVPRSGRRHRRGHDPRSFPAAPTHADRRPAPIGGPVEFRIRPGRTRGFHSLPSQQFQALFNSLFKVLFTFPSRYLFAIGLSPLFSLRWNLPPA